MWTKILSEVMGSQTAILGALLTVAATASAAWAQLNASGKKKRIWTTYSVVIGLVAAVVAAGPAIWSATHPAPKGPILWF